MSICVYKYAYTIICNMRRKRKELFMHTSPIYAPISNAMASAPDSPFSVARVVNYRIKGIFEYRR